jgi:hypothetical protein
MRVRSVLRCVRKIAKKRLLASSCVCVCVCVCVSSRLSVCVVQPGSHWMDLMTFWYLINFLRKSVERNRVSLKSDKNNEYFTWKPIYSYIYDNISVNSSSNGKLFMQKLQRKSNHILHSITFFFRKSCLLWDSVEKYGRAGHATGNNKVRALSVLDNFGYRLTVKIRNTYCFSTSKMVTQTHISVVLYAHCLSLNIMFLSTPNLFAVSSLMT